MENKRFLTAQDVMEMLDVSLSYAYKLIRRLNAELEAEGFVTIKGRVSTQYFMERIYGLSNTGRKAKNTQDIMIFSKGKARNMRIDTKRTEQTGKLTYMSGCKGMLPTMFDVQPVSKKNRIHQSELPVSLCEQILEFLIYEGEVVLDSFAGSGAVGEAALNLKRNCILIEILKDNIEKIKKRFENNVLMKTAMEW